MIRPPHSFPLRQTARAALAAAGFALAPGCALQTYQAQPLNPVQTADALDARSFADPGLRRYLRENLGRDPGASPDTAWDFEALAWTAVYFNPSLEVARAQWQTARAATASAAERPNPTLALTPGFSSNPAGASPWFPALAFDFPLETAGKRDRRTDAARHAAEAARQSVVTAAWSIRRDLRHALADLSGARARLDVLRAQSALQQHAAALLDQRRAAGALAAPDVAAARLAALRADALAADAERQLPLARQRLATALGLPVAALEGVTFAALPTLPPPAAAPLAAARHQSLQTRSDVLAALARYAATDSALALEVARQYPDVHLGPGYQWDQGQNKWSVGVSFELPLFNRHDGPIAEAVAHRREAAAQFLATQAQALAEIDAASTAVAAAASQLDTQRRVQRQLLAQQTQIATRQHLGAADPLDLAGAQLETATGELALLDATNQLALAAGELEDALQIPFDHLPALLASTAGPTSPP